MTDLATPRFWGFRNRAWIGGLILTPLGLITLFSPVVVAENTWADLFLDTLAWTSFILGGALRFYAMLFIGGCKGQILVTEGPYSVVRNPLYLGSFLLALSGGFFLDSVLFTAGIVLAAVAYALLTVSAEEAGLRNTFGKAYDEYCARVPRFIPRFSLFHSPPTIEVSLRTLRIEAVRAMAWIWIPAIAEFVEKVRSLPWWPHSG